MTNVREEGERFKCNECNKEVEVLTAGGGQLICCDQPMEKTENSAEYDINEKYRCDVCGNEVGILAPGEGELVCCGAPMELIEE